MIKLLVFILSLFVSSISLSSLLSSDKQPKKVYNNHLISRASRIDRDMIIDLTVYDDDDVEYVNEQLKNQLRIKFLKSLEQDRTKFLNEIYNKEVNLYKFRLKYNLVNDTVTNLKSQTSSS